VPLLERVAGRSVGCCALCFIAHALGRRDAHQHRLLFQPFIKDSLGLIVPTQLAVHAGRCCFNLVEVGAQRQDVE
jgi:hypothetical protein